MDILSNRSIPAAKRPEPYSAVWHYVQRMVGWLIGFFNLTEEDRSRAGIHVGSKGHGG